MSVPLFDLTQQHKAIESKLSKSIDSVLHSGHYILGKKVDDFERAMSGWLNVKHAIGLSSGTDALLVALMALGIQSGDEVICPSFTFFAAGGCIARLGAKPVFADCLHDSFNIDVEHVKTLICDRTKAIIPVHLFGRSANMHALLEVAQNHNIPIIEDVAQALGTIYRGKYVGTWGTFGALSFFPTKNLGACGDAGMLITNDDSLAEKVRCLRMHGSVVKYYHASIGGNFRIDAIQAALLSEKLPHLKEYLTRRKANARYYLQRLSSLDPERVFLPSESNELDSEDTWNQFTLRVIRDRRGNKTNPPIRDILRNYLAEAQIGSEVYYPLGLHQQACFRYLNPKPLPVTEALTQEVLSLPIFPELTSSQQDKVIDRIQHFFENH